MARIAFDIDEKDKREIKIRLAKEGRTLSEVMRTLCLCYKDFGLPPDKPSLDEGDVLYNQGSTRHRTITLYLDEKKATRLSDLATSTGRTKSELISFLIDWTCPSMKHSDIIVDRNDNDTPQDNWLASA